MRISDWSSDVCSSDLHLGGARRWAHVTPVIAVNSSSKVWADTAYRSRTNETWLADRMLTSRIHRRKAKGKSMPKATARANAAKSAIRARIEHVPAHQKNRFGLFIRPVGLKRVEATLTLATLAFNFER